MIAYKEVPGLSDTTQCHLGLAIFQVYDTVFGDAIGLFSIVLRSLFSLPILNYRRPIRMRLIKQAFK